MKKLDFLIIGAQKCATTTLFEHLRGHPAINMPLEKEVPFFTRADYCVNAWSGYAQRYFGAEDGRLWGKATPQYLCDGSAPERIKALMPAVKLVVILRDPIDRTWSHYQMGRRRGTESRDFDTAVSQLLGEEQLAAARAGSAPTHAGGYESEGDFYVAWSEYGRMLQRYTTLFGPQQLLILFAEDLRENAAGTLDRLLAFIGLEPGFRPGNLNQVIHRGGGNSRIPLRWRVWLRQRQGVYRLWQLLPEARRGRLRFLYEQWNVRREPGRREPGRREPGRREPGRQQPGSPDAGQPQRMSASTESALRRHFADDLASLAEQQIQLPPWTGNYAQG